MAREVARLMTRYARRRIVPELKRRAPSRTGRLRRSLGARPYGDYGVVIGAVNEPYDRAREKATGRRHPGVYGFIINQRPGVYEGWFTKVIVDRVPKMIRALEAEARRLYLQGENNDAR